MITEDYCSYEVAKLLEEKGLEDYGYSCIIHKDGTKSFTHQMALKWLREIHNVHVDIGYDDLDWFWNIISISENVPIADRPKFLVTGTACHRTYEEAVEAALKYVLENLI